MLGYFNVHTKLEGTLIYFLFPTKYFYNFVRPLGAGGQLVNNRQSQKWNRKYQNTKTPKVEILKYVNTKTRQKRNRK